MLRKYSILFGITLSILLLIVATVYYPGGSQYDKNSIGYSWKNNYLSDLFTEKSVNGAENTSRLWAIPGMLFLCASFALFVIDFSKKIPVKSAAGIVKYFGIAAMISAFLIVTPYHDIMVTITCTLILVSMFYITVFVLKSELFLFKFLSVACLLAFYISMYMYYTSSYLNYLPISQKITLAITIVWIVCLQYGTTVTDFQSRKKNDPV